VHKKNSLFDSKEEEKKIDDDDDFYDAKEGDNDENM
jgi:hypothetical protein